MNFTIDQLVNLARITQEDIQRINQCRRQHNKLGFGYQLSYVKMTNRFPTQVPFEVIDDILNYTSVQLSITPSAITSYAQRRETIAEHQEQIREYCGLMRFSEAVAPIINEFLFHEACRLQETGALMAKTEQFLRSQKKKILTPSIDTLRRMIGTQRKEAREYIFKKIVESLPSNVTAYLDQMLQTNETRQSDFATFKQAPLRPSPAAKLKLIDRLVKIETTGIL